MPPRGKMPSGANDRPKDRRRTLLRLWKYFSEHIGLIILAFFLMIGSNGLSLFGPHISGLAIDAIGLKAGEADFPRVIFFCGLMAVFYLVSACLSYILSRVMINLSQSISRRLRQDVFEKLMELPVSFFDKQQIGDIISRISYDIDTVSASLSNDILAILTSVITVVGSFVMMIVKSPILVLVFVVTIPISLLFTRYMMKHIRPLFRKRSKKLGELNGYVEEVVTGQKTIKVYHCEDVMQARFDEENREAVDACFRAEYYGGVIGPSVNFIGKLSLALTSMFGAILFLKGNLSLGNLQAFVMYSGRFSGPINEIANIASEIQSALAAAERVFTLIDEEPELADVEGAIEIVDPIGNVAMEDVNFGYLPEKQIIHNLNLTAKSGSLVAIVGPTGAGKTTLINLLMRFYDPQEGRITLDENDIRDCTRSSVRKSYAMVLQDTWLFHGTVFDNIAYGKKDATMEEVVAAAKAAKIHRYIMSLPDEYNTVLNEDGMNISQGQKQLMTIARAMLLDAKMLILDEATSNVDTRTELRIQEAMRTLMKDKTCFVIAHRLSTIQNADTILVIQKGDVVEQGNHEELLKLGGVYAGMYRSQFV